MPREEYLEFIRKPRLCEPWEKGISLNLRPTTRD